MASDSANPAWDPYVLVFLKQHLNKVVLDASFTEAATAPPHEEPSTNDVQIENETGKLPTERKKLSKDKGSKKKRSRGERGSKLRMKNRKRKMQQKACEGQQMELFLSTFLRASHPKASLRDSCTES